MTDTKRSDRRPTLGSLCMGQQWAAALFATPLGLYFGNEYATLIDIEVIADRISLLSRHGHETWPRNCAIWCLLLLSILIFAKSLIMSEKEKILTLRPER